MFPELLDIATTPNQGKLRAERCVESCRANDDINGENLPRGKLNAFWREAADTLSEDLYIWLGECLKVLVPRGHSSATQWVIRYESLAQLLVAPQYGGHVLDNFPSSKCLHWAIFDKLLGAHMSVFSAGLDASQ